MLKLLYLTTSLVLLISFCCFAGTYDVEGDRFCKLVRTRASSPSPSHRAFTMYDSRASLPAPTELDEIGKDGCGQPRDP